MSTATVIALLVAGSIILLLFTGFALVSLREREHRAAGVSCSLGVLTAVPFFLAATLPFPVRIFFLILTVTLGLVAAASLFLPGGPSPAPNGRRSRRVDERDIMFARARLRPGTREYRSYYEMRPENQASDDRTRALPGLLSPEAQKAEAMAFASAEASFAMTEAWRHEVDGPVAAIAHETDPLALSLHLKTLARYHGARDVGITELKPYHVYSHVGRGTGRYGEPITLEHGWAIAFTVEMDHGVMQHAPEAPVVAESARQYVESAKIAIQLAAFIRSLGYPARAHIDGNYRVIAPLVAVDAGLGELGRMGLVMTPALGPRVRLGVVTTELSLVADPPGDDPSVIDFCTRCRKCAENCPPRAIPLGGREPIDHARRWVIDAESCFRYWNVIGTDCGRCMAVCPYSHPDSAAHNLVRSAARRSGRARRFFLWLDDLFYGRHPATRHPPATTRPPARLRSRKHWNEGGSRNA